MSISGGLPPRNDGLNLSTSIGVLVVQRNNDFNAYVAELGKSCFFEVTSVDHFDAALQLLSVDNSKFDLLLIDNEIIDADTHTFLGLTKNMDMLSIVLSSGQENDSLIVEAFKSGAFLVLQKPVTMEEVMLMYQDVIRERLHKNEKHKHHIHFCLTSEVAIHEDKSCGFNKRDYGDLTKEVTRTNFDNNLVVQSSYNDCEDRTNKRLCVDWTPELHEKFLYAINHLGDKRCFPKEILVHMGVPGLTRMQVASHLQKHRNDISKYGEDPRITTYQVSSHGGNESEFGYMPSLTPHQNEHGNIPNVDINMLVNVWQTEAHNMNNQNHQSSMMNGPLQENTSEPTSYTPILIGNGLDRNQHEGFGTVIFEPGFVDLDEFFNDLDGTDPQ